MNIRVILIKPGEKPEVMHVENTLKSFQGLVEGYIQMVHLTDDVALICNEEGKIHGLKHNLNFCLPHFNDVVVGNIVLVGIDDESGEFVSLTPQCTEHLVSVFTDKLWIDEV